MRSSLGAFSQLVRRERRNLLLASSVSLFLSVAGVPAKGASILGLELAPASPRLTAAFLFGTTLYFFCGFCLYGSPEFRAALKSRSTQQDQRLFVSAMCPYGKSFVRISRLTSGTRYG